MNNVMQFKTEQIFYNSSEKAKSLFYPNYPNSSISKSLSFFNTNSSKSLGCENDDKNAVLTGLSEERRTKNPLNSLTQNALLFKHSNRVNVPKGVVNVLRRNIPVAVLRHIHPDKKVAVELCVLFLSKLPSRCMWQTEDNKKGGLSETHGWKSLKADILTEFFGNSWTTYKKIISVLEYAITGGAIIECDYKKVLGKKNYNYKLNEIYYDRALVPYEMETTIATSILKRENERLLKIAMANPICRNLIQIYPHLLLPSIEEIKREARRLIKLGFFTKKGKRLVSLNKHTKGYYKNPDDLSFVEDSIELFLSLTANGLMVPMPGNEESGGRVVDSFTLMPSWIRKLVKYKGQTMVECDYSCLHPNIANALYGGIQEFLLHQDVADLSGIDVKVVKEEHLSFFNMHPKQMEKSPLYPFYLKEDPGMLKRIITEKYLDSICNGKVVEAKDKHKITSRRMFKKEVDIMMAVNDQLLLEGISVLYVYDALIGHPDDAERLKDIMDRTILEHGVKTVAKLPEEALQISACLEIKKNLFSTPEKVCFEWMKTPDSFHSLSKSIWYAPGCIISFN